MPIHHGDDERGVRPWVKEAGDAASDEKEMEMKASEQRQLRIHNWKRADPGPIPAEGPSFLGQLVYPFYSNSKNERMNKKHDHDPDEGVA
jgi:hypothetical protein